MRFFRSSICSKTTVELTFTAQNKRLHSLHCLFCFRLEIPFLGKYDPKTQKCQFKLKFGTKTNLNMQNSMMLFTFCVFDHKYPSQANLIQKLNCQFKLKTGSQMKSNMKNSLAMFIFLILIKVSFFLNLFLEAEIQNLD